MFFTVDTVDTPFFLLYSSVLIDLFFPTLPTHDC